MKSIGHLLITFNIVLLAPKRELCSVWGSKWGLSHLELPFISFEYMGFFSETLNTPIFRTIKSKATSGSQQLWKGHKHLTFPVFFRKKDLTRYAETIILNLAAFISYLGLSFPPSRHSLHLSNIITSLHTCVLFLQFLVSTILSPLSIWQFPRSCLFSKLSLWLQLVPLLPAPSQSSLFPVHREAV